MRYQHYSLLIIGLSIIMCTNGFAHEKTYDGSIVHVPRLLDIDVWINRGEGSVYYPGDRIRIYFRTSEDCYVTIYNIDSDGFVRILFPYAPHDNGFVYGGKTYRIPSYYSHYELVVSGPPGIEYIEAVASYHPCDVRHLPYYHEHYEDCSYDDSEVIRRVTGDPFLAIVKINERIIHCDCRDYPCYAEDYTFFYVSRRVWYPRYVCYDCHGFHHWYYDPYFHICCCFDIIIDYDYWIYYPPYKRYKYKPIYWYREKEYRTPSKYKDPPDNSDDPPGKKYKTSNSQYIWKRTNELEDSRIIKKPDYRSSYDEKKHYSSSFNKEPPWSELPSKKSSAEEKYGVPSMLTPAEKEYNSSSTERSADKKKHTQEYYTPKEPKKEKSYNKTNDRKQNRYHEKPTTSSSSHQDKHRININNKPEKKYGASPIIQ